MTTLSNDLQADLKAAHDALISIQTAQDPAHHAQQVGDAIVTLIANYNWDSFDALYTSINAPYDKAKFKKLMQNLAHDAAAHKMQVARSKLSPSGKPAPLALGALKDHPVHDAIEAHEWLEKSELPLFAKATYKKLGTDFEGFVTELRELHADAAMQAISHARTQMHSQSYNHAAHAQAYEELTHVRDLYFVALGIEKIDQREAMSIGVDEAEYTAISQYFTAWQFTNEWRDARETLSRMRWSQGHYPAEYCMQIMTAFYKLESIPQSVTHLGRFESLGHSYNEMRTECANALTAFLKHSTSWLDANGTNAPVHEYETLTSNMHTLQNIMGELHEHPVFAQTVYGTLPSFMASLNISAAISQMKSATSQADAALITWNMLAEADAKISDADIDTDDTDFLKFGIDMKEVNAFRNSLAPTAARELATALSCPYRPASERLFNTRSLDLIQDTFLPTQRVVSEIALERSIKRLQTRLAQEYLFKAMLVSPGSLASLPMLEDAIDMLQELDESLYSPWFYKLSRLPSDMAYSLSEKVNLLQTVEEWDSLDSGNHDWFDAFRVAHSVVDKVHNFMGYDPQTGISNGNADLLQDFLHLTGQKTVEDVYKKHRILAQEYINTMIDDDVEYELELNKFLIYEMHKSLFDAVQVLSQTDRVIPAVFQRITGCDYTEYQQRYEALEAWNKQALQGFAYNPEYQEQAANIVAQALDPKTPPEKAYNSLYQLAAFLESRGDTIVNDHIVNTNNLNEDDLPYLAHDLIVRIATQKVIQAQVKQGFNLTLDNAHNHPYHDFVAALKWLSLSTITTVLHDKAYQGMGLSGRTQFMGFMQDAGLDYLTTYTRAVMQAGPRKMGAFTYISALNAALDMQNKLGMPTDAPVAQDGVINISPGTMDKQMLARIVRSQGIAALTEIKYKASLMPDQAQAGYIAKNALSLVHISNNIMPIDMQQEWAKQNGPNGEESPLEVFTFALKARLYDSLERFSQRMPNPVSHARYVRALQAMQKRHHLAEMPWFQGLFIQKYNMPFATFCDLGLSVRGSQVIGRAHSTYQDPQTNVPNTVNSGQALRIARDITAMHDLAPESLTRIFQDNNINPDDMRDMHKTAMIQGLPLLSIHVTNPFTDGYLASKKVVEWAEFNQAASGSDLSKVGLSLPVETVKRIENEIAMRSISCALFNDIMRGTPDQLSQASIDAHNMLSGMQADFANTSVLQAIGLNPSEVASYTQLNNYVYLLKHYTIVRDMHETKDYSLAQTIITDLFTRTKSQNIDITNENELQKAGIVSYGDFVKVIDRAAMIVVKAHMKALANEALPYSEVHDKAQDIIAFMQHTSLESRQPPSVFADNEVPRIVDIETMLTTRNYTENNKRKGGLALPANINRPKI